MVSLSALSSLLSQQPTMGERDEARRRKGEGGSSDNRPPPDPPEGYCAIYSAVGGICESRLVYWFFMGATYILYVLARKPTNIAFLCDILGTRYYRISPSSLDPLPCGCKSVMQKNIAIYASTAPRWRLDGMDHGTKCLSGNKRQ